MTTLPHPPVTKLYEKFFTPLSKPTKSKARKVLNLAKNETLAFNRGHLAISSWGTSGPKVLLVHGWGGSRGQMAGFVQPLLEAGYQVLCLDLPAHGESDGTTTNVLQMGDALEILAAQHGPFHAIVAHSFGTLATSYTLTHRNFPAPAKLVYFGTLNRLLDTLPRFQAIAEINDALMEQLAQQVREDFGEGVLERITNENLSQQIEIPTLMFHDQNDLITPIEDSRTVARGWESAQLIETEGLGHRRALVAMPIIRQVIRFIAE